MQTTTRWLSPQPAVVGATWLFAVAAAIGSYLALSAGGVTSAVSLLLVPSALVAIEAQRPTRAPKKP